MSAFGGKADMTFCESPLSRSLLGLKRTSLIAAHMSGSERTFGFALQNVCLGSKADPSWFAFAVAVGGKADMPFCTAYVR